jgi:hypothetical protein
LLQGQGIAEIVGTNCRVSQQFTIQHAYPTFAQTKLETIAGLQMFFWSPLIDAFCGSMAYLEHLLLRIIIKFPAGNSVFIVACKVDE